MYITNTIVLLLLQGSKGLFILLLQHFLKFSLLVEVLGVYKKKEESSSFRTIL